MIFALVIAWFGAVSNAQACADAWVGKPLDDLMRAWGPPSAMATLSDGSKVAEWSYERQGPASIHNYGYGNWGVTPGGTYHCVARITADVAGTITAAKVDGNFGGCNSLFRDKEAPT
jgi:hypothetical protein